MKKYLFGITLGLLLVGCSVTAPQEEAVLISTVRPAPADLQSVSLSIKRTDYVRALESSRGPGNVRIVPMIVSAAQAPVSPEYRIFNVRKGSVGELLGLENSDVLVAAHNYVIRSPSQFYTYLMAVQTEPKSQIEIRRGTKPLLITFEFTDN